MSLTQQLTIADATPSTAIQAHVDSAPWMRKPSSDRDGPLAVNTTVDPGLTAVRGQITG
jgi:hypothetical protein